MKTPFIRLQNNNMPEYCFNEELISPFVKKKYTRLLPTTKAVPVLHMVILGHSWNKGSLWDKAY